MDRQWEEPTMFIREQSRRCAALLATIVFAVSSADAAPIAGENGVKEVVARYNQALAAASRSGDIAILEPLATKKIVDKTFLWIHSWQDSNLYMKAELTKLDFNYVQIDGNTSTTRTREEWIYTYYDAKTKKNAMPKTQAVYDMKYTLFSHQGKWVISNIKILSEKHIPLEKLKK